MPAAETEEIPPRETVYVNNLNERINHEELKKSIYAAFSQFGPILEVVALKTLRMRGQAFIVFRDISAATQAVRNRPWEASPSFALYCFFCVLCGEIL